MNLAKEETLDGRYYFEVNRLRNECVEDCPIYNNIRIGSIKCRSCINCAYNGIGWVACTYINKHLKL